MKILQTSKLWLEKKMQSRLYFLILAGLSFLDVFLIVLPLDPLLIAAVFARPKRWWLFALSMALAYTLGLMLIAWGVRLYGVEFIHQFLPEIESSSAWIRATKMTAQYGHWAILVIAMSPIAQQPIVALAAIAGTSMTEIALYLLIGRLIKFNVIAYAAYRSPPLIRRIFRIKEELAPPSEPPTKTV